MKKFIYVYFAVAVLFTFANTLKTFSIIEDTIKINNFSLTDASNEISKENGTDEKEKKLKSKKTQVQYQNMKRPLEDGLIDEDDGLIDLIPEPQGEKNVVLKEKFCYSYNGLNIKTLSNRMFQFNKPGEYVLYELEQDFFITAAFRLCGNAVCNCALFITKDHQNPQTAFIDFCNALDSSGVNFEGFDGNIFGIDKCRNTENLRSIDQAFDDDWWESRKGTQFMYDDPTSFLDCAFLPNKISSGISGSYFYKSINENKKNDFIVEVKVEGYSIALIKVYPSKKSESKENFYSSQLTGGLCGRWTNGFFNPKHCDLFYRRSQLEYCVKFGEEMQSDFVNYWRVQNYLSFQK